MTRLDGIHLDEFLNQNPSQLKKDHYGQIL